MNSFVFIAAAIWMQLNRLLQKYQKSLKSQCIQAKIWCCSNHKVIVVISQSSENVINGGIHQKTSLSLSPSRKFSRNRNKRKILECLATSSDSLTRLKDGKFLAFGVQWVVLNKNERKVNRNLFVKFETCNFDYQLVFNYYKVYDCDFYDFLYTSFAWFIVRESVNLFHGGPIKVEIFLSSLYLDISLGSENNWPCNQVVILPIGLKGTIKFVSIFSLLVTMGGQLVNSPKCNNKHNTTITIKIIIKDRKVSQQKEVFTIFSNRSLYFIPLAYLLNYLNHPRFLVHSKKYKEYKLNLFSSLSAFVSGHQNGDRRIECGHRNELVGTEQSTAVFGSHATSLSRWSKMEQRSFLNIITKSQES